MDMIILLKHLVDVLDNPVCILFPITLIHANMAGKKDIRGIYRPYVKAMNTFHPCHL
jgi:hypothetical protein